MVNQNLTEVLLSKKIVAVIPFYYFSTSGDFSINEKLQLKNLITQKKKKLAINFTYVQVTR